MWNPSTVARSQSRDNVVVVDDMIGASEACWLPAALRTHVVDAVSQFLSQVAQRNFPELEKW